MRNEKAVKSWLLQIAKNRVKNYYRSRKLILNIEEIDDRFVSYTKDMDDKLTIEEFISSLPPEWSRIFYLNIYYEISAKELSEMSGIGYHAIKKRITRTKKILARELLEKGG